MARRKSTFDLSKCARPNILSLKPYRCARDDYKDDGTNVLLDANENAFGPCLDLDEDGALRGPVNGHNSSLDGGASASDIDLLGLNRYPDPHQDPLKAQLCQLRNTHSHSARELTPANLFLGVGSDEAIDALLRCFCAPGRDRLLICPPTYGMYGVSAAVNDVAIVPVPLRLPDFQLDVPRVRATLAADPAIKLVYLCSPGNPTGRLLRKAEIAEILAPVYRDADVGNDKNFDNAEREREGTGAGAGDNAWNGVVVVDEAYIDFSSARTDEDGSDASLAEWVLEFPNLVVLQTLSKAFGLAGIRLGAAFASREVTALLNNLRAPYNISSPTSALARRALATPALRRARENIAAVLAQRARLLRELPLIPGVGRNRGGTDANFVLFEMLDRPTHSHSSFSSPSSPSASSPPAAAAAAAVDGSDADGKPSNEVALAVYRRLAETRGVVVRFRGSEYGCDGCLRITVGTPEEVDRLLLELRGVLAEIYAEQRRQQQQQREQRVVVSDVDGIAEEKTAAAAAREASAVVA